MRRGRLRSDPPPPPVLSKLDRLISAVSPAWALHRMRARAHLGLVLRHYEGAAMSRRTENWRTPPSDANEAARGQLATLRNRCRDLARNNSWAKRGVGVMSRAVVGTGIMLRLTDPEGHQLESGESKEARAAWNRWALTKECDADGRSNLYGLQLTAQRTLEQSGELLVRRRWRRPVDGLTVPMQLQLLEPDYIDRTMEGPGRASDTNEPVMRIQGIEFDQIGRRRGYWMFREHPGAGFLRDVKSVFVPASEIQHIYRVDRPGQVVGVPPLAPAIVRTRDLDEFEDAWLMRNKIAAMFAGFIRDSALVPEGLQPTQTQNADGTIGDTFEPGMLETLPPGKDIVFADPPSLEGYSDYTASQLRAIGVSLDVTYEQLTGDLRGTNFTSGRMGWITHAGAVDEWRWDVLVPGFLDETFAWFLLAFELAGNRLPADVFPRWTAPRREMIDPTVETAASIRQVRAGLMSYSEALRENGYERDEVLDELERDMTSVRDRKLLLEVDPLSDANRRPADTTGNRDNGGRPAPAAGKVATSKSEG